MIRYLLYRPIGVCVIMFSLAMLGGLAFQQLPISLLPDIPVPEITIQVKYSKASARELQRTIEQPLRNQLLQVSHIDDISSLTQDGLMVLTLRFNHGTNIRLAHIEVNEKIDALLGSLPNDMPRPNVIKAGTGDIPVFTLNVLLTNKHTGDFLDVSEFCENVLKRRIEQLPDVALVDATGLSRPEVVIRANPKRLSSLGLSEQQLVDGIKQSNLQPGNFIVREGSYEYNIRFSSRLNKIEDVKNILIAVGNAGNNTSEGRNDPRVSYFADNVLTSQESRISTPVRLLPLSDLAEIQLRERPLHGLYSFNGKRSIGLAIVKQNDAQLLHLRNELNSLLSQFSRDYPQLKFELSQDQTELLELSINNLISNLLTGALLTFGMLFFFMRDWKLPFLVGLVIPVSIAITFGCFYLLNLSINIVSIAGLILGMGEIVDSAIIILENIDDKRNEGKTVADSCIEGTEEVIRPLFTSVVTNSAVFLPLLLLSGIAGALFLDQAISVSLALGVSLLCSYIMVPVLYNIIYKRQTNKLLQSSTSITRGLDYAYNTVFKTAFKYRWSIWLIIPILIIGAVLASIRIDKQGMPTISRTEFEVFIDWNEPISINESEKRINKIQKILRPAPVYISAFIGQQQFLLNRQIQQTDNQITLNIKTLNNYDYEKLIKLMSTYLAKQYSQATINIRPGKNIFEELFNTSQPTLRLKIHDAKGQQLPDIGLINEFRKVLIENGYHTKAVSQYEYLTIKILNEKLLLYDVSEELLLQTLRTVFNNNEIDNIHSEHQLIPLIIAGPFEQNGWEHTFVQNKNKQSIPIQNLIEIWPNVDYKLIHADKEGPFVPLDFDVSSNEVSVLQSKVDALIRRESNNSILSSWTGRYFLDLTYIEDLIIIIAIAAALMFCVLTAQFESLKQPMIVLLIIILGLAGSICFLYLANNSINILSIIGMIVLIGLLDNDSILKIDTINRNVKETNLLENIRLAGQQRLKSQTMTFLTTILGLIPVLFSGGLGSELQKPLALSIIGGMCVGIFVSWTVIPILYWNQAKKKTKSN